jgi:hypothetical protein
VRPARSGGDRPEGELLVPRDTELAHEEHVERSAERASDLEGDGHAAAREAEHHHVVAAGVLTQPLGEQPPRLGSIPEAPHGLTRPVRRAPRAR